MVNKDEYVKKLLHITARIFYYYQSEKGEGLFLVYFRIFKV